MSNSGETVTHTYVAPYTDDVTLVSQDSIIAIASTEGGWDFSVGDVPPTVTSLAINSPDAVISGSPPELPTELSVLDLSNSPSVFSGYCEDFIAPISTIRLSGTAVELTGYVSDLPEGTTVFDIEGITTDVICDFSQLPNSLKEINMSNTSAYSYTASRTTTLANGIRSIDLSNTDRPSDAVDDLLIALSAITVWNAPATLDLGGNNAARTSASDAAVATLEGNGVTVTVNESTGTYDDTVWIGEGNRQNGSQPITINFPPHVEGDLLMFGVTCRWNDTPVTPDGWVEVAQGTSGTTDTTSCLLVVYYQFAPGPNTTVTIADFGNMMLSQGFAVSNVDKNATLNVVGININNGSGPGVASTVHEFPGDQTSVPKGRAICIAGFGDNVGFSTTWDGGNLDTLTQVVNIDGTSGSNCGQAVAEGVLTVPGSTGLITVTTTQPAEAVCISIVLTPTSSGAVLPPVQADLTLSVTSEDLINLRVTTDGGEDVVVDWGDGTVSAVVASGTEVFHQYSSNYTGSVYLNSDGAITGIYSDTGGWDFLLTTLAEGFKVLNLNNADEATVSGTLSDLPSTMEELYVFNTQCVITGDLADLPSGMTKLYVASSLATIGGSTATMPSSMTFLSLKESASNAACDIADLNAGFKSLRIGNSSCTLAATAPTAATELNSIEAPDLALSTAVVDAVINAVDAVPSWAGNALLDLGSDNSGRSSPTTDAAVAAIESAGGVVVANIAGSEPVPVERVGIIAQSTVKSGFLDITGGADDDDWRAEVWLPSDSGSPSNANKAIQYGPLNGQESWWPVEGVEDHFYWSAYWQKDWPLRGGKVRTELKRPNDNLLNADTEYWIGVAVFIPDTPEMREITGVVGKTNNHCLQFHFKEPTKGTCGMNMLGGTWRWGFGAGSAYPEENIGEIAYGQWNKIIVHTNMSTGSDGFVKTWLNPTVVNGQPTSGLVYDKTGQVCTVDGMFIKAGIYRFYDPLPTQDIQYFYDSYRVGNANSNFISVYPGTPD